MQVSADDHRALAGFRAPAYIQVMDDGNPGALPDLQKLRAVATRIGRELDWRLVVLFGSFARGEPRPADLDIAIMSDQAVDSADVTNRLIRALGTQSVDLSDLRRADPLLLALVARDGIPLYERELGEFARFASLAARRYADTRKFRQMEQREIRDLLAELPTGA